MNRAKQILRRFTREEAEATVGRTIRSRVGFAGVPKGTVGHVEDIYHYEPENDGFDVIVKWDLPRRGQPVRDRFGKTTYDELLAQE